jgi:hypothetical protein
MSSYVAKISLGLAKAMRSMGYVVFKSCCFDMAAAAPSDKLAN